MTTEQSSSGGEGATPATPAPATGIMTASGATPPKQSATTLEEALARIAELEHHSNNKSEEAARHGKNLSAAQKELDAYKEKERLAQEAALSESQRLEKRAIEAEQQIQQYKQQLVSAQVQLAAQKIGIIDPEMAALAVQGSLEYGKDGLPSNLDDALKTLVKNKPYLLAPKPAEPTQTEPSTPASPAQTAQPNRAPAVPAMNPGRTSIAQPGSLPPGKPTRLNEVPWSH